MTSRNLVKDIGAETPRENANSPLLRLPPELRETIFSLVLPYHQAETMGWVFLEREAEWLYFLLQQ